MGREFFAVDDRALAMGLTGAEWPGRMQKLRSGPLVDLLPADSVTSMQGGWELWLDGGHNAAAAAALADVVEDYFGSPVDLVVGMLRTRDPALFLEPLAPFVANARTVEVPGEESTLTAIELAVAAQRAGIDAQPANSVRDAVRSLADRPGGRILICGSLYLAGSVLAGN